MSAYIFLLQTRIFQSWLLFTNPLCNRLCSLIPSHTHTCIQYFQLLYVLNSLASLSTKKPLLFLFLILAFLFFYHVTVEVGKQCSLDAQNTIDNQGTTIHLPYITIHLLNSPDLRITRIIQILWWCDHTFRASQYIITKYCCEVLVQSPALHKIALFKQEGNTDGSQQYSFCAHKWVMLSYLQV